MSQQLQITGGAKVRDLQDVIIGTSGVLSSLAFNVANGVPKLDVNGKILVSQLPNSVMEYQGTWNAATNTPTLVNGTGNQGDVYLCNVAGTTNFGAGPITFAVGDSAIYSGTIWQRAGGATGTVTSVGLTSTGNDAITITGSPITTSGNINLGFAGTNLQYINGAGDLTTFPTLISSIGLTMPSAFSVANSPLTANGTIAVTGAGYPSQYIRGDGTLADFPTSGGGGSSVSYYLNGGTSQGTIGGVTYYEMSKTADTGTGVDFNKTGDGFIVAFLTDAGDPAQLNIPAGNWNYEIYASMSSNGGTPQLYAELYVYDGTTFTLISTSSNEILYDGVNLNLYTFAMAVPATTLALTDRLAIKLYATNSGGKTTTVHTQDSHLCQIITTFSTGITALNGLTAQVQYFATGTSGTDFAISSATATHTFNLPVASAANTGKLSSTDWSTFNGKVPYTGAIANVDLGGNDLSGYYINGTQLTAKKVGSTGGALFIETGSGYVVGGVSGIAMASGSANNLSLFFIDATATNTKNAILNFASLTNNTNRTYTLPDASGTLTLTSDLSGYVTLATAQTISGDKIFTGINSFDYAINYKTGASLANVSGYISQAYAKSGTGAGSTLSLKISDGNSVKAINLDFVGSPATYTYTFPAASGTLALTSDLSSYVPYTGATGAVNLGAFDLTVNGVNVGKGAGSGLTYNTRVGALNFMSNTTGAYNSSFGYESLNANTTGLSNTAIGFGSLFINTTGNYNTAIGSATMQLNITGSNNTAVGYGALGYNLGSNNIAVGSTALVNNTTGSNNTAIGPQAGSQITTGANNTLVGGFIGSPTISNNIILSDGAGNIRYQWDGTSNNFDGILKSSGALWVNTSAGSPNSMIILAQVAGTQPPTLGNSSIGVNTTDFRFTATTTSTNFKSFSFSTSSLTNNSVRTYSMPDADGTLALGTGTTNYHAKWTGTNTIGNSLIWDNGTNVGIGTSSPASPLTINATAGAAQFNITRSEQTNQGFSIQAGGGETTFNSYEGTNSVFGEYVFKSTKGSTTVERMRINGSGYVGIGKTPSNKVLELYQDTNAALRIQNSTTGTGNSDGLLLEMGGSNAILYNYESGYLGFGTAATERMRITSDGIVYIGLTNPPDSGTSFNVIGTNTSGAMSRFYLSAASTTARSAIRVDKYDNNSTTSQVYIDFTISQQTTACGSITANGANQATFTAWSDRRLKENITELTPQLKNILALKPSEFDYKDGSGHQIGFIAQEMKEVYPDSVGENAEGFLTVAGWNKTEAILVKAIQELSAQNQDLKSRLDKAGL